MPRQAMEGLHRTNEFSNQVFENSSDAILLIDPEDDTIIDANSQASTMLGYTREEFQKLTISDIHPKDAHKLSEFVEQAIKDGRGWSDKLT